MSHIECKNCHYGDINWWGYTECYKFNQRPDGAITSETADRERTVIRLNSNNDCAEFEKMGIVERYFPRLYLRLKMTKMI